MDQGLGDLVQDGVRLGRQLGGARGEANLRGPDHAGVQQLGLDLADLDRAALLVHLQVAGGVRALVEAVEDAVAVAVQGAAALVDDRALGGLAAGVGVIEDAVAVAVQGAAALVDRGAGRRVGAGVVEIDHAVAVAVQRAAGQVDGGAGRGLGAAVETVADAVAVIVPGLPAEGELDAGGRQQVVRPVVVVGEVAGQVGVHVPHLEAQVDAAGAVSAQEDLQAGGALPALEDVLVADHGVAVAGIVQLGPAAGQVGVDAAVGEQVQHEVQAQVLDVGVEGRVGVRLGGREAVGSLDAQPWPQQEGGPPAQDEVVGQTDVVGPDGAADVGADLEPGHQVGAFELRGRGRERQQQDRQGQQMRYCRLHNHPPLGMNIAERAIGPRRAYSSAI